MLEDIFQSPTSVSLFGVFVALLLLHLLHSSFSSQERREPPGPRPLPVFGNLFQVDLKRPDQSLFNLSKKYGPVFQIYLGLKKVVVLAGYRTVKQALVNQAEEFGNIDISPIIYDFNQGHGIALANGDSWKEMKRFALTTLRDFGMGKKMSEDLIIEECGYLIKEFEQLEGETFDRSQTIDYASSNVVSALTFGKRFDYEDPIFQTMVERNHETLCLIGSASIQLYNLIPWLGPFLKNWRDFMKNMEDMKADIRKLITDLKETLDPEVCRCFIDAFLIRKKHLEDSDIIDSHYHDENLLFSVINFFGAGTETTATTLKWSLLYMAKFPHIQDRVQEELSRVVGSCQIQIDDRKNLPYTNAVIHETQRFANIGPFSVPHATTKDVTLQGYFIKKGTTVLTLLTSVLYDENEWESPHSFNPSHFLDDEGKFIRRDAFMPFSAGRRACLGESHAKMELFLFFASLLQNFHFIPPPGVSEDDLDLKPVLGCTLNPKPQQLCAVLRR
ncbi:cytochrome P450 2K1 [Kryptolebias marmoratus]|uniref:Cytochrome P450 2K1-like n=1 Tax=Kryptolebias marmoratus TaxID=37003 RepID=A0A2L0EBS1_KRYMA|nr:cytochrome P450 2K1 [Kryptolebias marmoratus]AUX14885.1 cytochrome p450 CYP2K39 [Kryptolebias marmoratus]